MNLVKKIKEILDIEEKIQVKKNIVINLKDIDEQKRIDEFNEICKAKVSAFFIEIQDMLKDVTKAFDDYPRLIPLESRYTTRFPSVLIKPLSHLSVPCFKEITKQGLLVGLVVFLKPSC